MKSTALKKKSSIPIKKYVWLFLVLFAGALLVFFDHFTESPLTVDELRIGKNFDQEKAEIGYVAPEFNLRNLDGNRVSLSDYRGRVVILNFWATWCAPCRVEMSSFETLYRRFRSEGLTVLAVSLDKGADDKVMAFVDKYRLSFPVLLDTEGVAEKLYPTISIPFTFVIDKSGGVAARVDGAKNWESEETFAAVNFLLNQPSTEKTAGPPEPKTALPEGP